MSRSNHRFRAAFVLAGLSTAVASFDAFALNVVANPGVVPLGTTFTINAGESLDTGYINIGGTVVNQGTSTASDFGIGNGKLINQGFMSWMEGLYVGGGNSTGSIRNGAAGTMVFNDSAWLDLYSKLSRFENLGVARVIGDGAGFALVRGTIDNQGTFIIESANASCVFQNQIQYPPYFPDAVIINQGLFEVKPQAACVAYSNNYYPVYRQTGGETRIDGQFAAKTLDIQQGILNGSGTVTVSATTSQIGMDAVISPGTASSSVGTLTIGNALTLAGDLDMEIGGSVPGSFDVLHVNGTVGLGGSLNVVLRGGFTPQAGNTFDIVQANAVAGHFARINLPSLPAGSSWSVTYGVSEVRLSVQ